MRTFKHIATLIKNKRLEHAKQYSQADLSILLGYKNGQFISNVERALCSIPFKLIPKLEIVLNIRSEDLKSALVKDFEETIDMHLLNRDQSDLLSEEDNLNSPNN